MEDPKNNFFKMPNDYKDALCKIRISGEARQILDAIERLTWGWKKTIAIITYRDFRQMTGLNNWSISRAIQYLLKMRIIVVCNNATNKKVNYRIETDYTKWRPSAIMQQSKESEETTKNRCDIADNSRRDIADKPLRNNATKQQAYIKDNLKTNIKTEDFDILDSFNLEQLKRRKTELIDEKKEQQALNQSVQHYDKAITAIDDRIKSFSASPNPSSQKISRSKRKKVCKQ